LAIIGARDLPKTGGGEEGGGGGDRTRDEVDEDRDSVDDVIRFASDGDW